MSQLSKDASLSNVYTNHSVRATSATILSKSLFGAAQVMSVTGHKSVQSLTVYQRVDDAQKIVMGNAISKTLSSDSAVVPTSLPLQDITNELAGINPEDLFNDFSDKPQSHLPPSSGPVFNNCHVTWINQLTLNK